MLGCCPSTYFGIFLAAYFLALQLTMSCSKQTTITTLSLVSHVHPAPFADKRNIHVTSPFCIMRFFCQCIHHQAPLWLVQLQSVRAGMQGLCHKISGVQVLLPGKWRTGSPPPVIKSAHDDDCIIGLNKENPSSSRLVR